MTTDPNWDDDHVVLPDTTSDEREVRWDDDESNDARLQAERPPHWG